MVLCIVKRLGVADPAPSLQERQKGRKVKRIIGFIKMGTLPTLSFKTINTKALWSIDFKLNWQ